MKNQALFWGGKEGHSNLRRPGLSWREDKPGGLGRRVGKRISPDRLTPSSRHLVCARTKKGWSRLACPSLRSVALSPPGLHQLPFPFSYCRFSSGYKSPLLPITRPACRTLSYQAAPEIMPVQTQSRNQPVTTSDPFGDPNAIRLVPPVPPKVPSKRDTGMDNQRELTNARGQDPHRTKPIRSQTQQTVRSVDHFLPRSFQRALIVFVHPLATVVPKPPLVAPCPKIPPQYHLSQKNQSPSVARRVPPMRTLSIASIFQALGLVRPRPRLP